MVEYNPSLAGSVGQGSSAPDPAILELQNVLNRLSLSLDNFTRIQREIELPRKLDPQLQSIYEQYGGNITAVNRVFNDVRSSYYQTEILPLINNMTEAQTKISQLEMQILQLKQLDALKNTQFQLPPPQQEYIPAMSQLAFNYSNVTRNILPQLSRTEAYNEYFRGTTLPLQLNETMGLLPDYFKVPFGFNLQNALASSFEMKMEESQNPRLYRMYLEYQKDMYERSQRAALNAAVSSGLGIRGGLAAPAEFEKGILPAINQFSDIMGVDLNSSIEILKKLKEIHAIAADLSRGSATEIARGVDEATKAIGLLSKLLGSQDLEELLRGAQNIAKFGGGSVFEGLRTISKQVNLNFQTASPEEFAKFRSYLDPYINPYINTFGYTQAAIGAARYRDIIGENLQKYGDFYSSTFKMLGGASGITERGMSLLLSGMIKDDTLLFDSGRGDLFTGISNITNEISRDPTSFFMNLNTRRFNLREQYSGQNSLFLMQDKINALRKEFGNTLSDDEIMLSLMGGDPNNVAAYKEILKSQQEGFLEEQSRLRGLLGYQAAVGYTMFDTRKFLRDYSRRFEPALRDYESRITAGEDIFARTISGIFSDPYYSVKGEAQAFYIDLLRKKEKLFNTSATRNAFVLMHDVGKEFETITGSSVTTLTDKQVEDASIISFIASAVNTNRAINEIENLLKDPNVGTMITEAHIKKILSEGLLEVSRIQRVDSNFLNKVIRSIQNMTLEELRAKLQNQLPQDSSFMKLLNYAIGLGGYEIFEDKGIATVNLLANAMRSAGISNNQIQEMLGGSKWREFNRWGTRVTSEHWISSTLAGATAGAIIGSIIPGIGTAAGATAGSIAPDLVIGASIGLEKLTTYLGIEFGWSVDRDALAKTLFGTEDQTGVELAVSQLLRILEKGMTFHIITDIFSKKDSLLKMFETCVRAAAVVAGNKNFTPADVDKVANSVYSANKREFKEDIGRNVVRVIILQLAANPELSKDIKAGRTNAILSLAKRLLDGPLSDLTDITGVSQETENVTNVFDPLLRKGAIYEISNVLTTAASSASYRTALSEWNALTENVSNRLKAAGKTDETISALNTTLNELKGFIAGTSDTFSGISTEQLSLLEIGIGKERADKLRAVLDDTKLSKQEKQMRINAILSEARTEALQAQQENALKGQLYANIIIDAIRYLKNTNNLKDIKDFVSEIT